MRGFCGCVPNKQGLVPPLSDDFFAKIALGPAALPPPAPPSQAAADKFFMTQFKCAACGTTISGQISFVEHCKGKAHIKVAGFSGFAGLLPNDAGFIPPLPAPIAHQIGAEPGPQVSAAGPDGVPDYAAIAAAAAAKLKEEEAKKPPPPKPAHAVRMDQASLNALVHAARNHDAAEKASGKEGREPKDSVQRAKEGRGHKGNQFRPGPVPPIEGGRGPMAADRERLPIGSYREEVLRMVRENQVVVLQGDTGCGKTTQVPQFLLEEAAESGNNISIVCTQPRRISAMGVSERVAVERGEQLGRTVGYSIRLENKSSAATRLLFCTTGILLRRLEEDPCLSGTTHVVVDEVHERSVESDFLLMVLRDTLREKRRDLRVILMSATLDEDLFASYFACPPGTVPPPPIAPLQIAQAPGTAPLAAHTAESGMMADEALGGGCAANNASCTSLASMASSSSAGAPLMSVVPAATSDAPLVPAPCISVPGRTFPVTTFFLEEALHMTRHQVRMNTDWARKNQDFGGGGSGGGFNRGFSMRRDRAAMSQQQAAMALAKEQEEEGDEYGNAGDGKGGKGYGGKGYGGRGGKGAYVSNGYAGRGGGSMPGGGGAENVEMADGECQLDELRSRYSEYNDAVPRALAALEHSVVNVDLVVQLIGWLSYCQGPEDAEQKIYQACPVAAKRNMQGGGKGGGQVATSGKGGMIRGGMPPSQPPMPPPPMPQAVEGGGGAEMAGPPPEAGEAQAVLVFLQGIKEIAAVQEALLSTREYAYEPARSWVLPIHSAVPPEEQRLAFARPPPGVRKVVLATNIAETAITIDDVSFVIDCCRMKENRYDPTTRMESLEDVPISAANAKQRRGRAGRCRPGVAFHLVTRRTMNAAPSHQAPEVQRMPLDRLILGIKALNYDRPAATVCAALIEPPSPAAVERSIRDLIDLEALARTPPTDEHPLIDGEELTALGLHLSRLPVDVHIGKLILLGAIFGQVNDVLTIAATLSTRTPFLSPLSRREEADAAKLRFANGQSDHLTMLRAYNEWDALGGEAKFEFCRNNFLGVRTLQAISGLKRQLLELLCDAGFVQPHGGMPFRARQVEGLGRRIDGSDGVRLALAGQLFLETQAPPKPPELPPAERRRAEGFGQCMFCHNFGAGEFDRMDGSLYCLSCWQSYAEEEQQEKQAQEQLEAAAAGGMMPPPPPPGAPADGATAPGSNGAAQMGHMGQMGGQMGQQQGQQGAGLGGGLAALAHTSAAGGLAALAHTGGGGGGGGGEDRKQPWPDQRRANRRLCQARCATWHAPWRGARWGGNTDAAID